MQSTFSVLANTLKWVKQDAGFELRAGDEFLAVLTREQTGRTRVKAESVDGDWCLERQGHVKPLVTIDRGSTDDRVGLFLTRHGPQRLLLLLDGSCFSWKPAYERGKNVWKFLDVQDQCLFFVTLEHDQQLTATVEILPFARNVRHLPLLLVLGWYELWMEWEDKSSLRAVSTA